MKHLKKIGSVCLLGIVSAGFVSATEIDAKGLWDRHCKKCHGEDGTGQTPIGKKLELKDYTDAASLAELSDEELFEMTKGGVEGTKMKGYSMKLSDEEIHALVSYIRAMAK